MAFKFFLLILTTTPMWLTGLTRAAFAQAVPAVDITPPSLPEPTTTNIQSATSDTTVVQQSNTFNITGGQSSAGLTPNLIHQFQAFDLNTSDEANFIVNPDVANVISLINDVDPSVIDGLIRLTSNDPNFASGANLFLVNPAGIIFGANAQISLPADLTATTASGLLFEDTYLLSIDGSISEPALTSEPNVTSHAANAATTTPTPLSPLPTRVTPTVASITGAPNGYLFVDDDPTVASTLENRGHLQVAPQASINLLGNQIQNDGALVAPGGTINLVAISGEHLLRLSHPGNVLNLELTPADTLEALVEADPSPPASQPIAAAFSPTEIPQLLTGGDQESATQITVNTDGSLILTDISIDIPLVTTGSTTIAPESGNVLVRGTIDVSTTGLTDSPGSVTIIGDKINLIGGNLSANGLGQAGTLSIGGMPVVDSVKANDILIDRSSSLSANSAMDLGGIITIRAEDTIRVYGDVTATGADSSQAGSITIDADLVDVRQSNTTR